MGSCRIQTRVIDHTTGVVDARYIAQASIIAAPIANNQDLNRENVEGLEADKDQERCVVADADARVDPWAVVIIALDAPTAHITVVASWQLDNFTVKA